MKSYLEFLTFNVCLAFFYVFPTSLLRHEQHHILLEVFFLFYFRLQDGVPDTIAALREAGIKVGANFTLYHLTSFRSYSAIDENPK